MSSHDYSVEQLQLLSHWNEELSYKPRLLFFPLIKDTISDSGNHYLRHDTLFDFWVLVLVLTDLG